MEGVFLRRRCVRTMGGCRRRVAVAACIALAISCAARPVSGQAPAAGETVARSATKVIAPAVQITNLGWDDNIFRVDKTEAPVGDFTATVSPSVLASIPLSRVQFTGAGQLDFNYFQRFDAIRSIDADSRAAVAVLLGRLT